MEVKVQGSRDKRRHKRRWLNKVKDDREETLGRATGDPTGRGRIRRKKCHAPMTNEESSRTSHSYCEIIE